MPWEEKSNHQVHPATKPSTYNKDLLTIYTCVIVEQMFVGVTNPFLVGFEACSMRWNLCLTFDRMSVNWRLDGLQYKGKAWDPCSAEGHGDKRTPVQYTKYLPAPGRPVSSGEAPSGTLTSLMSLVNGVFSSAIGPFHQVIESNQ